MSIENNCQDKKWRFVVDGKMHNQLVTKSELSDLFLNKKIASDTLIWCYGMDGWEMYASLFNPYEDKNPPPIPITSNNKIEPKHDNTNNYYELSVDCASSEIVELENFMLPVFLSRLAKGEYGLVKTYWIYGILVGLIVNAIAFFVGNEYLNVIGAIMLTYGVYSIFCLIGIWSSASKWKGNKIWSALAKIISILGGFGALADISYGVIVMIDSGFVLSAIVIIPIIILFIILVDPVGFKDHILG